MAAANRNLLLYWTIQVVAWTTYMLLLGMPGWLENAFTWQLAQVSLAMAAIGVASSHVLRTCYKEWHWLDRSMGRLVLHMVLGALVMGAVAGLLQSALHDAVFPTAEPLLKGKGRRIVEVVLGWMLQLFIWEVIYTAYHFIVRSRLEELRALRLEAANREGQLSNLRSQLNPHFMFNALNSIRALIEEDPERAKRSITLLSSILRNAMSTVKRRTVPLGEEIDMVRAYLLLESMRYEERLRVSFNVDQALERSPVPPMMLQTLVENAVRHGIAKRKEGGDVQVVVQGDEDGMLIQVRNTGRFKPGDPPYTGIGLRNTEQRLEHIYGRKAKLNIYNEAEMVVCEIRLPLAEQSIVHPPTETES